MPKVENFRLILINFRSMEYLKVSLRKGCLSASCYSKKSNDWGQGQLALGVSCRYQAWRQGSCGGLALCWMGSHWELCLSAPLAANLLRWASCSRFRVWPAGQEAVAATAEERVAVLKPVPKKSLLLCASHSQLLALPKCCGGGVLCWPNGQEKSALLCASRSQYRAWPRGDGSHWQRVLCCSWNLLLCASCRLIWGWSRGEGRKAHY